MDGRKQNDDILFMFYSMNCNNVFITDVKEEGDSMACKGKGKGGKKGKK